MSAAWSVFITIYAIMVGFTLVVFRSAARRDRELRDREGFESWSDEALEFYIARTQKWEADGIAGNDDIELKEAALHVLMERKI